MEVSLAHLLLVVSYQQYIARECCLMQSHIMGRPAAMQSIKQAPEIKLCFEYLIKSSE